MTHETCSDGLDRSHRMTRRGRTPRARWLLAGLLLGVLVLPGCAWLAPGEDPVSPCACDWRDLDKRTRA